MNCPYQDDPTPCQHQGRCIESGCKTWLRLFDDLLLADRDRRELYENLKANREKLREVNARLAEQKARVLIARRG